MNNVTLVGNLTRDPAFFKSGEDSVAKFDLATKYGYDRERKEDRTEFVPITAFGVSDAMKEHLKKGRKVSIVGRVGTDSYEKEGAKVYSTTVKVSNGSLQFVDPKPKAEVEVQ